MADTGTKNVNPSDLAGSTQAQGTNRFDRPLGRGLEEISHLFLSQTTNRSDPCEPTWSRSASGVAPQSGVHAGTILLRPHRGIAKDGLIAALREFDAALEESVRAIDVNVQCDPCGEIDLIAIDRANQLTIIDGDTACNDGLLLRGIGHIDWIVQNVATLRRMYHGRAINFSLQPRLILVAPQFSRLLKSVARQIGRPQIDCVRYHLVEVSAGTGIFFEHVEDQ